MTIIGTKNLSMPCNKALSFCRSKIILDRPNYFGRVEIVLDVSKLDYFDSSKSNWTPRQLFCTSHINDFDSPKSFWTYKRTRHKFFAKEDGENNLVISLQFPVSTFKEDLQGCILHLHYLRKVHGLCQAEWIFFKAHASCLVPTRIMFYKQRLICRGPQTCVLGKRVARLRLNNGAKLWISKKDIKFGQDFICSSNW